MSIADNLRRVRERIANAAEAAGRQANDVTLVGVTKYVDAGAAWELVRAGCLDLGESRPQELWSKTESVRELAVANKDEVPPPRWHLIGHLQRNKIRRTLPLVSLIHSVDSERLLAAIDTERQTLTAAQATSPVRVLLEVNTSGEPAKHGLRVDEVEPLLASSEKFTHVEICGLMTMAALTGGLARAASNFAALRTLGEQLQLRELSMGMSGDYEVAIREGATIVRIGSALWE